MSNPAYACKPDLAESLARFEAWWVGELIDRPPVSMRVLPQRAMAAPAPEPATIRELWTDPHYKIGVAFADVVARDWPGDSVPSIRANLGPDLTGTLLGVELEFGDKGTSWSHPIVRDLSGWHAVLERPPAFDGFYWQTIQTMTRNAFELCRGQCLVQMPDLHNCFDMLVALRGPEALCMDLVDEPELVLRAARKAAGIFKESMRRSYAWLEEHRQPSTCWASYLHAGFAYITSCDFWALISQEMARELVLPLLLEEMEELERAIFHLDGRDALRHLDLLLFEMPGLQAVQWVYGAGAGSAKDWLPVYRRILDAGKGAQVLCATAEEALLLLDEFGPRGLWLCVAEEFPDTAAAEAFLRQVGKRS